jgi:hypothetical protein
MFKELDKRDGYFHAMQALYETCEGGKSSSSMQHNLTYLITSGSPYIKEKALEIFANYHAAAGRYEALCKLAQGLANI